MSDKSVIWPKVRSKFSGKLFCFSPPVMLATFAIEIVIAVYAIFRYRTSEITKIAVMILVCLAAFQIAEFNVCAGGWIDPLLASRLGYVAISLLPPLGIHFIYALAGAKKRPMLWPVYAAGAAFIIFFLGVGHSLTGHACEGNYVIFQMLPGSDILYGLYYYGLLLVGITESLRLSKGKKPKIRRSLQWMAVGYLALIVPTTTANFLSSDTLQAIPSVMCGFAVTLALVIGFIILPIRSEKR